MEKIGRSDRRGFVPVLILLVVVVALGSGFLYFLNAPNHIQTEATQLYYKLLPVEGRDRAIADTVVSLNEQWLVQDSGVSAAGDSIWIKYKNGTEGVLLLHAPGTQGVQYR